MAPFAVDIRGAFLAFGLISIAGASAGSVLTETGGLLAMRPGTYEPIISGLASGDTRPLVFGGGRLFFTTKRASNSFRDPSGRMS